MLTTRIFARLQTPSASNGTGSQTSSVVSYFRAQLRGTRWEREDRAIGSQRARAALSRYAGGGAGVVNATNSMNRLDILTVPQFDIGEDDETEEHKVSLGP